MNFSLSKGQSPTTQITARIISIGDELLHNGTPNSNGAKLSARLESLGVTTSKIIVIGDSLKNIAEEIAAHFIAEENILILTGGLGSTQDDLTVNTVAQTLGLKKIIDPNHLNYLKKILQKRNLPERFLKQAVFPQGFTLEKSPYGTAPFLYRWGQVKQFKQSKKSTPKKSHLLILLPGVPYECLSLFENKVLPLIKEIKKSFPNQKASYVQEIKIISLPESVVEDKLMTIHQQLNGDQENRLNMNNMEAAFLPSLGELLVRLRGDNPDYLKKVSYKLLAAFPDHQSYASPINIPILSVAERLHHFFVSKKYQVGFAESCTGGLLTSQMVSFPGSSAYLDSGLITYSNQSKSVWCGVSPNILKKYGAVSPKVAEEMAVGLAKKRMLHLAVSITGIAGPGGSSKNKPVGLVYIAVYHRAHRTPKKKATIIARKFLFPNLNHKQRTVTFNQDRQRIQDRAVKNALFMMMEVCFSSKKNRN